MESKKQEAIRLSYGDKWQTVKESVNPDNGWCTNELFQDDDGEIIVCPCCKHIFNQSKIVYCINSLERCPNCNGHVSQYEYHYSFINVPQDAQKRFGEWRPKSLSGLEDNNGWISINSEKDLPKHENEKYHGGRFLDNGEFIELSYRMDLKQTIEHFKFGTITHFQKSKDLQPPIY